jgi:uncharacterized OB-fold protein
MQSNRPLPVPTPETTHFWEGTRQGELRLQRCQSCDHVYFPPRPFCPTCASKQVAVFKASGRGSLFSYVVSHLPAPGFEPPYTIAVVELEEGPRMMTNIVGTPPDPQQLPLDAPVEVEFVAVSDSITLPMFRLAESAQPEGTAR